MATFGNIIVTSINKHDVQKTSVGDRQPVPLFNVLVGVL